ncbi:MULTISPECIES: SCO family protein [unclassified Arsukibacterium]|mgnify:FL=1|uniref:SCO family protein n=1 Tax=unclassified Arsukibacterium TaxID=2635278 RepID=UPI000C50A8A1|nr:MULTISPECIES: SCO family protein [unclassified Arsukibacterium]MAA94839.1 SCO family protein [Rheinheimera sp.]MBM34704.1 SCO family protein [Rheinheimera sp.]HAW93011.1 SCO family protein [Candidatus Azambacteria bacterium]|tara:strand:+ start:46811 stop:47452 length:642 start_codon:yes stop_codon:yes gene_type:complete
MFRNLIVLMLSAAALVAGVMLYLLWQHQPLPQQALIYPQPRNLSEFSLINQENQRRGREDLLGKWTLAFVGYTYCPDICPLTLAKLAGVHAELAAELEQPLQIWFISVDPQRDTPGQLKQYVDYFKQPALSGLTAGHDQLFPFVRELGLMYAMSSTTAQDYLVDHSASVVLINPQGQVAAMFKPDMAPGEVPLVNREQLLADFPLVLNQLQQR